MNAASPTGAVPGELNEVFLWSAVLLVVAIGGGVVIMLVRRLLRSDGGAAATGFTLHELRELRDSGRITNDEFERARAQIIARVRAPSDKESRDAGPPESSQPE